jgi:hypothetical protein
VSAANKTPHGGGRPKDAASWRPRHSTMPPNSGPGERSRKCYKSKRAAPSSQPHNLAPGPFCCACLPAGNNPSSVFTMFALLSAVNSQYVLLARVYVMFVC